MATKYCLQCTVHPETGPSSSDIRALASDSREGAERWLQNLRRVVGQNPALQAGGCSYVIVEFDDADYPDEVQDNG